jgi:hypothetical protein
LHFRREFRVAGRTIHVCDRTAFCRRLRFERFLPVVIAVFPTTPLLGFSPEGRYGRLQVEVDGFRAVPLGRCRSSTGEAVLVGECIEEVGFQTGDVVERCYRYHLPAPVFRPEADTESPAENTRSSIAAPTPG